jgi:hypothetical protein
MSNEIDKIKHSKRLYKNKVKSHYQAKIAKSYGNVFKSEHVYEKRSAMTCGDSNCVMCGNPRKFRNEETMQEKTHKQMKLWDDE